MNPKLVLSANMLGKLRLGINTDSLKMESTWTGLENPELDPANIEGGIDALGEHPSTKMKRLADEGSDAGWATVRIDGKDWSRVLGVGRLAGRVIACTYTTHRYDTEEN
jgi:HUS1 checkpoint protein